MGHIICTGAHDFAGLARRKQLYRAEFYLFATLHIITKKIAVKHSYDFPIKNTIAHLIVHPESYVFHIVNLLLYQMLLICWTNHTSIIPSF